jgi:hypothetical protein
VRMCDRIVAPVFAKNAKNYSESASLMSRDRRLCT